MRISDWSSDVVLFRSEDSGLDALHRLSQAESLSGNLAGDAGRMALSNAELRADRLAGCRPDVSWTASGDWSAAEAYRSEEHTSELQSLMRISYAVFCLKKKNRLILDSIIASTHTHHIKRQNT